MRVSLYISKSLQNNVINPRTPLKYLRFILTVSLIVTGILACKKDNTPVDTTATVHVEETEEGFHLVRNNQPFFIKGGAADPDYLEELKAAGGNTARIYDTINLKSVLDKAQSLGLAVAVDIPLPQYNTDPKFYEDKEFFLALKERVERVVKRHRNHPALLYWTLGNELAYPYFYKRTSFFSSFNELINLIHDLDPDHPVTTAIVAGSRKRIISIKLRSPGLDFISLNTFGSLTGLDEKIRSISFIADGPFVISEWGINGPWEETETAWEAPIEATSTKKADIIRERASSDLMENENNLGAFFFYWGRKQERTATWFGIFDEEEKKNEVYYELSRIWGKDLNFSGPRIKYLLLNNRGAAESIILSPNEKARIEVAMEEPTPNPANVCWEIRKEAWFDIFTSQPQITDLFVDQEIYKASFITPMEEGPYRIFYSFYDSQNNFSTANVPFYVLKPEDEE